MQSAFSRASSFTKQFASILITNNKWQEISLPIDALVKPSKKNRQVFLCHHDSHPENITRNPDDLLDGIEQR